MAQNRRIVPDILSDEQMSFEAPSVLTDEEFKLPETFRPDPFLGVATEEEFYRREADIKEKVRQIPEGVKGLGTALKLTKKLAQRIGLGIKPGEFPEFITPTEKKSALEGAKFVGNVVNELFWRPLTGWYQSMLQEVSKRQFKREDYISGKAGFQSLPRAMARGLLGIEDVQGKEILEAGGLPKTEELIIKHPVLATAKEVWGATLDVLPLPILQPIGTINKMLKEGKYSAADRLAIETSETLAKARYEQMGNPLGKPWEQLPQQTRNVAIKMTGEAPIKQLGDKSIAEIFYDRPYKALKEVAKRQLVGKAGQLRIGDSVKFGNKIGEITGFEKGKALLIIAGKQVSADLAQLKPTEAIKANALTQKELNRLDELEEKNVSGSELTEVEDVEIRELEDRYAQAGVLPEVSGEEVKLLEFKKMIRGEGFIAVPSTPEFRKFVRELPENIQKREAIKQYEQIRKKLEKPLVPSRIKQIIREQTGQTQQSKELLNSLKEKYATEIKNLKLVEELDKKLATPLPPSKVKPVIHKVTGKTKIVDIVRMAEDVALREQLRVEAKGAKAGYKVGKKEIREEVRAKNEVRRLVTSLNRIGEAKNIDLRYKEQIDDILEKYDFKRRTAKTMARREGMQEFINRQKAQGEQILIPEEHLAELSRITLNDMTLDDLRSIHQTVSYLGHIGKLKNKLIARKEWKDFAQTETDITQRIYKTGKKEPSLPAPLKTPSMRKRGFRGKITNAIDAFAAHQRKTEFIARVLDGFKEGVTQQNIIEPIQEAYNQEALKQAEVLGKLVKIVEPIRKDYAGITNKQYDIEGIPQKLTKQEAMAVYANSKSPINKEYGLIKGWGWNEEQISKIIGSLSSTEKTFVDNCMALVDDLFEPTSKVAEKLTGQGAKKRIGYWPKITDKELSTLATLRQKEQDLFQDVVNATYVERGFTKEIGKVAEPVSLNFFNVLLDHINKVIHFQTHALPVRDVQKLIFSPKIKQGITDVLGENVYRQFSPWLREVANPKTGNTDVIDKWAGWLKRNSTATILGLKLSVSLKQFGSYSQTIHELGAISATKGFLDFYRHPFKNIQFVYNKSPQMKFREKTFDREVREWMEGKEMKELVAGRKGMSDMIYSLIKTVDKAATLPTWYSSYQKNLGQFKDEERAVRFADGVVRRTQPAGSRKDLAAIQRGPNTKKLFTMFYTHFTNVYNQMANEAAKLRLGEKATPLRIADLAVAYWWLLIVPGLLGEQIRRLGKSRGMDLVKGVASYGLSSIAIIGNIANSMIYDQFDYYPSPALGLPREIQKIATSKKLRTKLKYAARTAGYITGLPMQQAWITLSGIFDLWTGQTEDKRRLGFSEWTLKGEKKPKTTGRWGKKKKTKRWE